MCRVLSYVSASILGGLDGICRKCWRPGFDPWVGKIPWRREWLPAPVSLPGESHGQRSLAGYSPWAHNSRTRLGTRAWPLCCQMSPGDQIALSRGLSLSRSQPLVLLGGASQAVSLVTN